MFGNLYINSFCTFGLNHPVTLILICLWQIKLSSPICPLGLEVRIQGDLYYKISYTLYGYHKNQHHIKYKQVRILALIFHSAQITPLSIVNGEETTAVATTTKEWIVCSLHKTESCAYSRNLGDLSEIRELTLQPNISSSQSSSELPCLWNHPY